VVANTARGICRATSPVRVELLEATSFEQRPLVNACVQSRPEGSRVRRAVQREAGGGGARWHAAVAVRVGGPPVAGRDAEHRRLLRAPAQRLRVGPLRAQQRPRSALRRPSAPHALTRSLACAPYVGVCLQNFHEEQLPAPSSMSLSTYLWLSESSSGCPSHTGSGRSRGTAGPRAGGPGSASTGSKSSAPAAEPAAERLSGLMTRAADLLLVLSHADSIVKVPSCFARLPSLTAAQPAPDSC